MNSSRRCAYGVQCTLVYIHVLYTVYSCTLYYGCCCRIGAHVS